MGDPLSKLTDDVLVDIISRVSYKSTCCCQCVARRWRNLISHPDHRTKLHQPTLAGFFFESYNSTYDYPKMAQYEMGHYYTRVSNDGWPHYHPSLSFLPKCKSLDILDCCNGLLLCRCWKPTYPKTLDYVVCNPATEKWMIVPATNWSSQVEVARLGFDQAASSHFHVFEFITDSVWGHKRGHHDGNIKAVGIYSSKTKGWSHTVTGWGNGTRISSDSKSVFFSGMLHVTTNYLVLAVDVEGNNWKIIHLPMPPCTDNATPKDIFPTQGQLYFANNGASNGFELWVLENYDSEHWTLKAKASYLEMFGTNHSYYDCGYSVISVRPEENVFFIVCGNKASVVSYKMDSLNRNVIDDIVWSKTPYIPYVPLFSDSESLADEHQVLLQ